MRDSDVHDLVAPYALGALEGRERGRFEAHLLECDRCRLELPGLQDAATALAFDVVALEPPAGLRERIIAAARKDTATILRPRFARRWTLSASAGVAAAAACAAVGLGIWSVSLSRDLDRERGVRAGNVKAVAVLADPTAVRYPLVGARGNVVVTRARDAALVVSNLRHAPAGKAYELWVVVAGTPRPAGLFSGGGERSLVALTRRVPHTAQVSVSLEPAGGSERLTGSLLFGAQTT